MKKKPLGNFWTPPEVPTVTLRLSLRCGNHHKMSVLIGYVLNPGEWGDQGSTLLPLKSCRRLEMDRRTEVQMVSQ